MTFTQLRCSKSFRKLEFFLALIFMFIKTLVLKNWCFYLSGVAWMGSVLF